MGVIHNEHNGTRVTLATHTLVGRRPLCQLRLEAPSVSSHHASLQWSGGAWYLRDLGSRNGTFVDGTRIVGGEVCRIGAGNGIVFGGHERWKVISAVGPWPEASHRGQEMVVGGGADALLLPDAEAPQAIVSHYSGMGWVLEEPGGDRRLVRDGSMVEVAGVTFHLHLPTVDDVVASTVGVGPDPVTIDTMVLHFSVSADEESVRAKAVASRTSVDLRERAHHYTLLTLARLRLQAKEVAPAERGWVVRTELAHMLRLTTNALNIQLFRARQQLIKLGVAGGGRLIEVREATGEVRLGVDVSRLEIRAAGEG
jgi:hypothetical protein